MHPTIQAFRKRRMALGISQRALAIAAGVSKPLIEKMECNTNNNPTLRTIEKIEAALAQLERMAKGKRA